MLNHEAALDQMFHALSDPSRRAMVDRLSKGPATVSELAQPFAMSLAAVVQHLKVLEEGGLVHSQKAGRVRTCRLHAGALTSAEQWISKRRALWEKRLDRLAEVLDEEEAKERKQP